MSRMSSMFTQQSTELHLNASASSFESYVVRDGQSELDDSAIIRSGTAIPAECCKVQRNVRSKLFSALVLLCFAFDFLLFFVCPELSRNAFGGVQGRRLSEDNGNDDDDLSLPSTPELLDLCFEIEKQLSSEEILPEAPRASPLMVQEVLDALEGRETSSSGIRPEDALQANIEEGSEGAYPSGKAAEKVGTPSSSVSSVSFESKEGFSVYDAGLPDAYGSASFEFHSISFENQLSTGDAHTETLRASPVMMQQFFEELERDGGTGSVVGLVDPLDASLVQNPKPLTLGLSVKRPAPDDGEDDDEVAGPSSKVAKTDTIPSLPWSVASSRTNQSPPSSAVDSTESGGSSAASSGLDSDEFSNLLDSLISESEPSDAPPVPPSVSTHASPSSTVVGPGPSSAPSVPDTTVHPWLRVPDFTPGVGDMEFRPECLRSSLQYRYHGRLMVKIRELLVQPKLDYAQARGLVMYSEYLANHAFHKMRGPVSSRRPTDAAELLGRRFMTFFLLHSASKALRQPWPQQQWWRDLASAVPSKSPFTPGDQGLNCYSRASVALAEQLSAAIELYKSGSAPNNDEIVKIMRKLFCSPVSPHHFKAELWDPWRQDDDPSSSSS